MATVASSVVLRKPKTPSEIPVQKLDRLALLYEGVFTAIVRVQTARQQVQDAENFRSRMGQALKEIASTAARRGYSAEDVSEANFAVVAFLDETVLTAQDPSASQWARKSLGEELFDQRSAGELFFKRLETLRANRDSQELAEVLEVYYLCLLLGYEGKYAGGSKAELQLLMTNLRERIERILGDSPELSPDAALPNEPIVMETKADPLERQVMLFALAALVLAIFSFLVFSLQLSSKSSEIERAVQERTLR
ncbi:MAG TPA: type IVB secretion system protein IcmH/DotU [Candidatus Sulfotelmatobacter sp.]|nr:type IVB secretion system protein IcmH/DotU [Candidatus Sulfotelmatobacter sp.]